MRFSDHGERTPSTRLIPHAGATGISSLSGEHFERLSSVQQSHAARELDIELRDPQL